MTAFAVLKSRLFTMFQTISWDIQELNIVVQLSWIMITWLVTHHIVWIMICVLYSIFNNNKISWDILLKIKKMFSPQNPGRGWTTWLQVVPHLGNLRHLRPFFCTKYQPQTWVQVVPHMGNFLHQTSTSNLGPSCAALGKRRDPDIVLAHLHLVSTWGDVKPSRRWEEFYQQKFLCYWRQGYTAKVFEISKKISSFVDLQFCNLFLKSSIVAW